MEALNNLFAWSETIFFSPHVHTVDVQRWLGAVKKFPRIDQLLSVLSPGAPADLVASGGDLDAELECGNHPSIDGHSEAIRAKILSYVVLARAIIFDALFVRKIANVRLSLMAVIDEPEFRIIHDLTFVGSRSAPASAPRSLRSSVN